MSKSDFDKGFNKAMQYYPRDIGYWKQAANGGFYCSSCGSPIVSVRRVNEYLFCPHCGANMQGRETAMVEALKVLAEATKKVGEILEGVSYE